MTSNRALLVFVTTSFFGCSSAAVGQGQTVYLQPSWRPAATNLTAYKPGESPPVNANSSTPYYIESPVNRVGVHGAYATTPGATTVAPWNSGARPAIVPDQMIRPMVASPSGLVPGAPAVPLTPRVAPMTPAQTISNPAPAPLAMPVVPSAPATPSAAPAVNPTPPMVNPTPPPAPSPPPTPTVASPPEPFVDPDVFPQGAQSWVDIDIASYTSRFRPGDAPEQSVREWIVRKSDRSLWGGGEVASLVVTPEHVRIYHTPAVQQQVRDLLGRFLYYTPGEFATRVQIVNARDGRWRNDYSAYLSPAGSSGKVWIGSSADVAAIASALTERDAQATLAREEFQMFNGQHSYIGWSPRADRDPDPQRTGRPVEDGVTVNVSPLIESDAATTELYLAAAVRRESAGNASSLGGPATPQLEEQAVREIVRLAPGQAVIASLGQVASFANDKTLLGKPKPAEVLVIIECRPSANNTVNGRPVVLASAEPQRSTSARPSISAKTPRQRLFHVPPVLTAPVD